MKLKTLIFGLIVLSISFCAHSQIKVKETGKLIIGMDRTGDDALNVLTASVFGPNGDMRYGGKLSFGDFGQYAYNGWNVFIGEYGNPAYDSDRLWLHGKNGIVLTYGGQGSGVIGYYNVSNGHKFTFNCDVYAYGTKLTSDERFKTNIKGLESTLAQLRKLKGVSYNYNFPKNFRNSENDGMTSNYAPSDPNVQISDKEKKDMEFFEKYEKENNNPNGKRLGFIAQDLQKVFPELVEQDSAGYFYVDYVGLIPVIIEALKEQDSIIAIQSTNIEELLKVVNKKKSSKSAEINSESLPSEVNSFSDENQALLEQNAPNPFNLTTNIGYNLPSNVKIAMLIIYNMNGGQLKSIPINQTGTGSITINGSELRPGMYLYTLIADGKEIDTKRMILTE